MWQDWTIFKRLQALASRDNFFLGMDPRRKIIVSPCYTKKKKSGRSDEHRYL